MKNTDPRTLASFGDEWQRFDQHSMDPAEASRVFNDYFSIFPWHVLPANSEGFDMGCGSGRWARFVAPRVGKLHCIDPSSALVVARRTLVDHPNVQFHQTSVAASGLEPNSQDFGYSLGVLHHVPNTIEAIRSCTELLKPGAPFLLYLYYAFDNRPRWFRSLWRLSNFARLFICQLPPLPKQLVTDLIAFAIYFPLSRIATFVSGLGFSVDCFPLSYYRHTSLYTMRTDARDRFGTPLEHRFTCQQIRLMCSAAGLVDLRFSPSAPFWCVVGFKGTTPSCLRSA
jgi:SAM-dependent methyltransferase